MIKDKGAGKMRTSRYVSLDMSQKEDRFPTLKKYSTANGKKEDHFDKYYIVPNLRYRSKNKNPKNDPEGYQDETFVYKNMHNNNFWNWVHPLDVYKLRPQKNPIGEKVNIDMLQKFKVNLQNKHAKRVPLLVQQILKGEI